MNQRLLSTIWAASVGAVWANAAAAPVWAQTATPASAAPSAVVAKSLFLTETLANFASWDSDRSGALSTGEIEAAIANPRVTGKAAAAAVTLRRAAKSKTYHLPEPITPESLTRAVADAKSRLSVVAPAPPSDATVTATTNATSPGALTITAAPSLAAPRFAFDRLYAGTVTRIEKVNRSLFASGPPKLSALKQGRIGDCFALAPLGALINRDPGEVVRMFQAEKDGEVTLTFGGGAKAVKVATVTDGEYALAASTGGDGLWANLYEKAVGQCRVEEKAGDTRTVIGAVSTGGSAGKVIELLTGNKVKRFSCAPFQQNGKAVLDGAYAETQLAALRAMLTDAMGKKRLACAGTDKNVSVPGISPNHAYALLEYDVARDEMLIWNPHGNTFKPKGASGLQYGYPTAGGKFRVPLPELVRIFRGLSFEADEKSKSAIAVIQTATAKTP